MEHDMTNYNKKVCQKVKHSFITLFYTHLLSNCTSATLGFVSFQTRSVTKVAKSLLR